jgi:hypothetical protein
MTNLVRRLERLERRTPRAATRDALRPIFSEVMQQMSDDDKWVLEGLMEMQMANLDSPLSEQQESVWVKYNAAIEAGCRRAGFRSLAHARRLNPEPALRCASPW